MKTKEYWNIPDAGKKEILHSIPYFIFHSFLVYLAYLIDPENLIFILIIIGIGVWLVLKEIGESSRVISRPVCRLTDEFVISDYDRNVVPWGFIARIVTNAMRRTMRVYYLKGERFKPYSLIKGKWMQDWDSFLKDLEIECEKRSVKFTVET